MKPKQPPEVFYEKKALKNFVKFTGKHLCLSLLFIKAAGVKRHRYFPVKFAKFLRTYFI